MPEDCQKTIEPKQIRVFLDLGAYTLNRLNVLGQFAAANIIFMGKTNCGSSHAYIQVVPLTCIQLLPALDESYIHKQHEFLSTHGFTGRMYTK